MGKYTVKKIQRMNILKPKTPMKKLKTLVCSGVLRPKSNSKLLNYFKTCNNCPLSPKSEERMINGVCIEVAIPARCHNYKEGGKCPAKQGEFINKMQTYFKIGETQDTLELQKAITYSIIENAEICFETEMLKNREPGFYTHKFQELASNNINNYNKLVHGELKKNVNVDLNESIVNAWKKRNRGNEK